MKPVKLKMKAFGPYVEEIVLFEQLNNGLFLITGDTGAGKTTIFDAMVFALYGEGSGTSREKHMFHSDYVSKNVDTEVTFTFLHNAQLYEIYRTIHFEKTRDRKGFNGKINYDKRYLKEPNGNVIKNDIDKRIEELIGLNSTQFRQIVMLAQGEFQAFLKAENSEKKKILGNLFDNSAYVSFQKRLDEAEKLITKNNEQLNIKLSATIDIDNFSLPKEMDELEKRKFNPNHPNVIVNLEQLIESETDMIESLKSSIRQLNASRDELNSRLTQAEHINEELKKLDELNAEKVSLDIDTERMNKLQTSLKQAEIAYRKVYPYEKDYLKVNDDYLSANFSFEDNKDKLTKKKLEFEEKENELNKNQYINEEIEKLAIQIKGVEEHLNSGDYDLLFELSDNKKTLEN